MIFKKVALYCSFFISSIIYSQFADCSGAIPICETSTQDYNVSGIGTNDFPNKESSGCLGIGAGNVTTVEANSIWFKFKAARSGKLGFNIIPGDPSEDWDFALYGPNPTCGNLAAPINYIDEVNCGISNYYPDNPNDGGRTGAGTPPSSNSADWYVPYIDIEAGKEYILLINSYFGNNNAFTLEWTGELVTDGGENPLDCSIVTGDLGADQKVCNGTAITLNGKPDSGIISSYKWFINTGAGFNEIIGETGEELIINNNLSGTYRVEIIDEQGNTGSDDVEIAFYPVPVAYTANDINLCDADNGGINSFDLQTSITPQILNGQDANQFEVIYFLNQADANNNTNPINNPYINSTPYSSENIFARIHNKDAKDACYATSQFKINTFAKPQPQQPTDYIVCDDAVNGDDTDGFYNNFVLSNKDNQILSDLSSSEYKVSYHYSLSGAQTDSTTDLIDKNIPYRNITINSQIIYVRVENINNPNCFIASDTNSTSFKPFKLVVNPLPIVNNNIEFRQCDTDTNLKIDVNLTLSQTSVSDNHLNETFDYYPSENDAINNTNIIPNPTSHTITNDDIIWVRTISSEGCYRICSIKYIVGYSTDIAYNKLFVSCDDFLDTNGNDTNQNNDTDGITNFDLSSVVNDVKALFPSSIQPDLDVLIFETTEDRNTVQNAIPNLTNYRNVNIPAPTPKPLYIKIINKINNNCRGLGEFTILANPVPEANSVSNITICDDYDSSSSTDGENINIDLTQQTPTLLGSQNPNDFTVTFHTSIEDSFSGDNPIPNPSNYRNEAQNGFTNGDVSEQTIYTRVKNNTTLCYNNHISFKIIINPLPIFNNDITPLVLCDSGINDNNNHNGLEQEINVSIKDSEIIGSRNPDMFTVSYHISRDDALTGSNPINKTNYDNNISRTNIVNNIGKEILWISLLDNETGCRYGDKTLTIQVNPSPHIESISELIYCDNDNDGDDTNGTIQNIDLTTKTSDILSNYTNDQFNNYKISYHTSKNGSENNSDIILSPDNYTNLENPQRIYLRVENITNGCIDNTGFFDIKINPLPDFNVTSPQIVCLNNLPLNLNIPSLGDGYSYKWTKNNETIILSNTNDVNINNGGNYNITVTNNLTNCERTRTIVVEESIIASITENDIIIVDDSNNNSITIKNENNNLGIGDYEFALQDSSGNLVRNYQDEPYFDQLKGGIYTILVQDKNQCGVANLAIPIIHFPKFFTPNDDGYNDTWSISGANTLFFPKSNINIFDRYGKLLVTMSLEDDGWNGLYNNQTLPSNDYWFTVELVDKKGIIRKRKGHFSLLRK